MADAVDVYDGRRLLGNYKVRPYKVEAWDADFRFLGSFPNIAGAVAAIRNVALDRCREAGP